MLGPFATTSRLTQAPLAVLRSSLGIAHVQLSCVTNVGLVCVVERCDLTELKEVLFTRCRYQYCRAPPAHQCPRRQRQRQRVTEGTAMAPWNGPNQRHSIYLWLLLFFAGI